MIQDNIKKELDKLRLLKKLNKANVLLQMARELLGGSTVPHQDWLKELEEYDTDSEGEN